MTRKAWLSRLTHQDRGAGLLSTSAGFLVFMLMLLAAVQIMFNLYATSLVTGAAYDAARQVASFDSSADRCAGATAAEASFLASLGDYGAGGHASLQWTCTDPSVVKARVQAQHPSILPKDLAGLSSLANLDRTIEVRVESLR